MKITVEIEVEDAQLLLSRIRSVRKSMEELLLNRDPTLSYVRDARARDEAYGRVAAELDNKLEQPASVYAGVCSCATKHNVQPPDLLPSMLKQQAE